MRFFIFTLLLVGLAKSSLGFSGLNDTVAAFTSQLQKNNTQMLQTLIQDLNGNATAFLGKIQTLFDDAFANICFCNSASTFDIFDDNQTSNPVQVVFDKFKTLKNLSSICPTAAAGIKAINDNVCKNAPTFDNIKLRALNLTELYINDTMRGWFCNFNRLAASQALQNIDFLNLLPQLTDPAVKQSAMGLGATITRCMIDFIFQINTTQVSTVDCRGPIAQLIQLMSNSGASAVSARTATANTNTDVMNAIMTHVKQMISTLDTINQILQKTVGATQSTTGQAANSFIDNLTQSFSGQINSNSPALPVTDDAITQMSDIIGQCLRCAAASLMRMFTDLLKWAQIIVDLKRATFCATVQYVDKIQNLVCQSCNTTSAVANSTALNLNTEVSTLNKNFACLEKACKESYLLWPVGYIILPGFALIADKMGLFKDTISQTQTTLAQTAISAYQTALNNIKLNCTNTAAFDLSAVPSVDEVTQQLSSCNKTNSIVPDFCTQKFTFSPLSALQSFKNYWNLFLSFFTRIDDSTTSFADCVQNTIATATAELNTAAQKC